MESLKDGDRVVCATSREVAPLQRQIRERNLNVEVIVISPADPNRLMDRGSAHGRTLFDHTWVEQYYIAAIERAQQDIDHLQQQTSGWGSPHIETRRTAEEMSRWVR